MFPATLGKPLIIQAHPEESIRQHRTPGEEGRHLPHPRYSIADSGYAAYVHSIKSENLHANTFGKITYDVNNNNYVRGQDLPPSEKYVSTQTKINIPPSEMLRRTAADIVGIPNKEIKINEPKLGQSTGPETDQFTLTKT